MQGERFYIGVDELEKDWFVLTWKVLPNSK